MSEQQLEIKENNGYKNITLKTKYKRDSKGNLELENDNPIVVDQGLEVGNHIVVEKTIVDGLKVAGRYGDSYSCKADYAGQEISFWLNPIEHEQWASTGGVGDKVKISLEEVTKTNKKSGAKQIFNNLVFETI